MTVLHTAVPNANAVDRLLSSHSDFADPDAIDERNLARLRLGLTVLSRDTPALSAVAERSDAELALLLRDPILRHAFEDDLAAAAGSGDPTLAECLPVMDLATGQGPSEQLASHGTRAWPAAGRAWLWQDFDRTAEPIGRRLEAMIKVVFPADVAQAPIAADPEDLDGLAEGAALLSELLPGVGANVLRHIGAVGLARQDSVEGGLLSLSGGDVMPATIFIGPSWLRNPWDAAGLILHEGLHLTLFEVIRCGGMLLGDTKAPTIPIPWRTLKWSTPRVLFALHVYVHMTLFEAAAAGASPELIARYGEPPAGAATSPHTPGSQTSYDTPLARASYLAEFLERVEPHRLTPYGRQFVGWLVDALEQLSPGVRAGWTASVAPPRKVVDPEPVPDGVFELVPTHSIPLPGQRRLAVATVDPPVIGWLNVQLWTIYALSAGQDLAHVQALYAQAVAGTPGAEHADRDVADGLQQLLQRGLITTTG